MRPPLSYRILKQYVRLGLTIYFSRWENRYRERVPKKGPFVFVGNHQNSFLDALLVVCGVVRNPWFLARGDVFNKEWATRLLTFLRIKPVFRFRDGHSAMRKNDRIINECIDLLKEGECILLFGEGTHNEPWTFRPLQRGFAHLALQYTEQTANDISVVPVGYHYENHHSFRSRVLVTYGEPISVQRITGSIPEIRDKVNALRAHTEEKLKELILSVPLDEAYPARKEFLMHNRRHTKTVTEQLEADRELMRHWTKSDQDGQLRIARLYHWFDPLFLYGRLTHLVPHLVIRHIVKKVIEDDQFVGSVKLAVGIFLIPLYYLLSLLAFYWVSAESLWTAGFFISLPITGLYAYNKQ